MMDLLVVSTTVLWIVEGIRDADVPNVKLSIAIWYEFEEMALSFILNAGRGISICLSVLDRKCGYMGSIFSALT